MEPLVGSDVTLDAIAGGRVQVLQRRSGYRFNLDPVLLTEFAAGGHTLHGPIVDLGTGSGVIPLLLARRHDLSSIGVELQQGLFELAQRNVALNGCQERVSLIRGDLRDIGALLPSGKFTDVLCNPPYHARRSGQLNPGAEKAVARHEVTCTPQHVIEAAAHLLMPRGSLWLVVPASRLAEWFRLGMNADLSASRLRCVHPRANRAARLALLQLQKQGRAPLSVLPPLFLHEGDRAGFCPEVQRWLSL